MALAPLGSHERKLAAGWRWAVLNYPPPHAFYSFRSFMQWIYLLNRHEKEVHGESRDFSCPEPDCNQSFKSKKNLTLHRNTHKTIKPFQCMWCDFTGRFIWNPGWFIPCSCLKVFWVWFWPVCFCGGMKMRIWDAMRVWSRDVEAVNFSAACTASASASASNLQFEY